jgi:hypothetical protein
MGHHDYDYDYDDDDRSHYTEAYCILSSKTYDRIILLLIIGRKNKVHAKTN